MNVYVITSGEYSDYCIQTVALSREKAEQICAMLNGSNGYRSDTAIIEEYDTDEIQCETNEDVGLRMMGLLFSTTKIQFKLCSDLMM